MLLFYEASNDQSIENKETFTSHLYTKILQNSVPYKESRLIKQHFFKIVRLRKNRGMEIKHYTHATYNYHITQGM